MSVPVRVPGLRVRSAVPPWPVSVMLALACSPMAVRVALSLSPFVVGAYSTVTWHDLLGPRLRPLQPSLVTENAVPLVLVSATGSAFRWTSRRGWGA
jgi:hypothetical protein